ncbi:ITSN [Mytilus edulis]|uniref:ITSN n=1 Tax=Mytilus edulis TaxID=6550 RepID=A0A8S3QPN5_MYTED|nr:ITSN [Mytilus edulis]
MAGTGGGDAWRISGEERMKHDSQFFQLKPVNGFITGEQARDFMQSGLPTPMLGQICNFVSDRKLHIWIDYYKCINLIFGPWLIWNNDGKMDKKEFSIAMHLIKKKLQGFELPKALPQSLKADPSPMSASMAAPMGMSMNAYDEWFSTNQHGGKFHDNAYYVQWCKSTDGAQVWVQTMGMQVGFDGKTKGRSIWSTSWPNGQPAVGFAIPHNSKLRHTQTFNTMIDINVTFNIKDIHRHLIPMIDINEDI